MVSAIFDNVLPYLLLRQSSANMQLRAVHLTDSGYFDARIAVRFLQHTSFFVNTTEIAKSLRSNAKPSLNKQHER